MKKKYSLSPKIGKYVLWKLEGNKHFKYLGLVVGHAPIDSDGDGPYWLINNICPALSISAYAGQIIKKLRRNIKSISKSKAMIYMLEYKNEN